MRGWARDIVIGLVIALAMVAVVLFTANAIQGFVYGAF